MFISLIFPCYNEEQAIPKLFPKAIKAKQTILQHTSIKGLEILVVDDDSKDNSLELLKNYKESVKIISLNTQKGYGSAIKEGIVQSKGDWIAFCDADNTCEPEELKLLINLARDKSLPVVWGNRLNKKSKIPFIRRLGNRLYQLAFLCLSFKPVPDVCSGFRLFKKSALTPEIYEFPKDLSFSLAITAHCIRYKIPFSTTDISYKERLGTSKLHPIKDGFVFLSNLIRFLFFKRFSTSKKKYTDAL